MENKKRYDKISFSGDTMKKQYLIYADESHRKGKYFSNFPEALKDRLEIINLSSYTEFEKISNKLNGKKEELGLFQEVKWTKVTEQYLDKYLELIDYFFEFVKSNKIKIRIMFRQNAQVPQNLTREHEEKEYFLLYYQFIKHAFGIDYCNSKEKDQVVLKLYFDKLPDTKKKNKEEVYPRLNFAISTYYKGTGLEEVLKKLENYLDNADINESDINNI